MRLDSRPRESYSPPVPLFEPEFLVCLNCETPTYTFDWVDGKITSAFCTACGNDDTAEFMTEAELDEQRS